MNAKGKANGHRHRKAGDKTSQSKPKFPPGRSPEHMSHTFERGDIDDGIIATFIHEAVEGSGATSVGEFLARAAMTPGAVVTGDARFHCDECGIDEAGVNLVFIDAENGRYSVINMDQAAIAGTIKLMVEACNDTSLALVSIRMMREMDSRRERIRREMSESMNADLRDLADQIETDDGFIDYLVKERGLDPASVTIEDGKVKITERGMVDLMEAVIGELRTSDDPALHKRADDAAEALAWVKEKMAEDGGQSVIVMAEHVTRDTPADTPADTPDDAPATTTDT